MPADDQIKELEAEFKLIKGELRQTMVSVRDYLLNFRPPTAPRQAAAVKPLDGGFDVPAGNETAAPVAPPVADMAMATEPVNAPPPPPPPPPASMMPEMPAPMDSMSADMGSMPADMGSMPADMGSMPAYMGGMTEDTMTDSMLSGDSGFDSFLPDESAMPPLGSAPVDTGMPPQSYSEPQDNMPPLTDTTMSGALEMPVEDEKMLDIMNESPQTEIADTVLPEAAPLPEKPILAAASRPGHSFDPGSLPVNLLTNLIRWVSTAKQRIGTDQLPIFLEIYSSSGQLSVELKDFIMRLVDEIEESSVDTANSNQEFIRQQMVNLLEICSSSGQISPEMKTGIMHLTDMLVEPVREADPVDVWSQLMIELQGIIAEGGEPLRPKYKLWQDVSDEVENADSEAGEENDSEPENNPAQLKLILPVSEVGEQEFVLNLAVANKAAEPDENPRD